MLNEVRGGRGRKLLLIHGLGGSWRSWSPVRLALSADREVIAIDLPGHGATPAEHDSGTFLGLLRSVEDYIAARGLGGVDLVGSSMGARIVLELARRGGVGNVVALDPGGFWQGWERAWFEATIAASVRLLRAIAPALPAVSATAAGRTALLAQLSARPWCIPSALVAAELRSFATTPTFDALVRDLAAGPEQQGPAAAGAGRVAIGWAGTIGSACPGRPTGRQPPFPAPTSTGSSIAAIFRCGTNRRRPSS